MTDVTRILSQFKQGDSGAAEELLPLVYEELRRLATQKMALEHPSQTLQATALVHEAYLKLVGDQGFSDRQHFFRVAAEAMRQVLVDRARRKLRIRHGGNHRRVVLSDCAEIGTENADELMALDEALERFATADPVKAELVKLRYFAGLSEQEVADLLGISRATASRYWAFARAWLIKEMGDET